MNAKRRVKTLLRAALPENVAAHRRLAVVRRVLRYVRAADVSAVFTDIYQHNSWQDAESVSGRGSTLARTVVIRRALPALLRDLHITSLLDAACGDFNWLRHTELDGISYIGADIVPALIARNQRLYGNERRTFIVLNIIKERSPDVDAILCRDCFIHLSFRHIRATVANFKRSRAAYLLATSHPSVLHNRDIETGAWRSVNLQLPPFNFPPPLHVLGEDEAAGKHLGVWRLAEL